MKTVTPTLFLFVIALACELTAEPRVPDAKLLDMYAVREGDSFVVHVLANGDISQFLSDRKTTEGSYKLTLDVPALSPLDSKYDVQTPFSRRFQVWPMQLGKKIYSRIELELELDTSSVVGMENSSHLFVRIQRESPMPAPERAVATTKPIDEPEADEDPALRPAPPVVPVEPPVADGGSESPATTVGEIHEPTHSASASSVDHVDDELFFSLFPTPGGQQEQTLFNVAAEDILRAEEPVFGIRVGRFNLQPLADFSWIRGENLLFTSEGPFVDNAFLARGRLQATLLESVHQLKLAYEGRYRDFRNFNLEKRYTHLVDLQTVLELTPSTSASIKNHFVQGSFESQEFDPGGEVVASTEPFYRNFTQGVFAFELSERFSTEITGSYNVVEFLDPSTEFFNYDSRSMGGTFLYHVSPLTSLLGEYVRTVLPQPIERPEAGLYGDTFLFGVRGEITPLLRGQIRGGYSIQRFDGAAVPQNFTGFVADASLTRDLGELAAISAAIGRRTSPSAYEENGYYVSNYGRIQFITPFARNFRVTASGTFYWNDYPVPDAGAVLRNDDIVTGSLGIAYFVTPVTYVSFDYRYDRRFSNLDRFQYRNNAIQLMVGVGFMSR